MWSLRLADAEALAHLCMKEAAADAIRLHPFTIDDELRDSTLAYVTQDFIGRPGSGLDVDLGVRDLVMVEKALGFAAVPTPRCRVED
jgi:hypothetical protein